MNPCEIKPADSARLRDESGLAGSAMGVCYPESTGALAALLAPNAIPRIKGGITVQGAQTGLVGGAVPNGGLVVNFSRMNRILQAEKTDTGAVLLAQAGASLADINTRAGQLGCFFAPNPSEASATLGGLYATGAAGPRALRYGAFSRCVRRLVWCSPAGEVWDIPRGAFVFDEAGCTVPGGGRLCCNTGSRKPGPADAFLPFGVPAAGLDLIDFLAGSEGRLGFVCELELELLPQPESLWGVLYFWHSQQDALDFVQWLDENKEHMPFLDAAEFIDGAALQALRGAKQGGTVLKNLPDMPAEAAAAFYVELSGDNPAVLEESLYTQLEQFTRFAGLEEETWAVNGRDETEKLRAVLHALTELAGQAALESRQKGLAGICLEADLKDENIPFGRLLQGIQKDALDAGVKALISGHALQHSLHAVLLPQNSEQEEAARALLGKWAAQMAENKGQFACQHGIGRTRQKLVQRFLPAECQAQRRQIKSYFDPGGVLP